MKDQDASDTPVLITEAQRSFDDEHAARKRKYTIMMAARVPLLILAGVFVQWSWILAILFVALSIPLPWVAVLIANDRPPRRTERVNRFRAPSDARQLESRDHQVIDSGSDGASGW